MKIGFIGDIVGRPGREMIKKHLLVIKNRYNLDFVIANGENASHGFGLSVKNFHELKSYGVDLFTGGNHSFDKKDIIPLLDSNPILRPDNYPKKVPGSGICKCIVAKEKLAVINLLGIVGMPNVDNPFIHIKNILPKLHNEGYKNIIIDFHAEATAEKRTMHVMLKNNISAILGTHTHIGTDDLSIDSGTLYVSDVGLSGCVDGVIGMDSAAPIEFWLSAIKQNFDIPKKCKSILQMIIMDIDNHKCIDAFKIKVYNNEKIFISQKACYI